MGPQNLGRTHLALLERLQADSERLEALHSSEAFEAFMVDHMSEFRGVLSLPEAMQLRRIDVSPDLVELHGYQREFNLNSLHAELIVVPPEPDQAEEQRTNWLFSATYMVDDEPFALTANGIRTTFERRNIDGHMVAYTVPNGTASKLMAAAAYGLTRAQSPELEPLDHGLYESIQSDDPDQLRQTLHFIAGLGGVYDTTVTAAVQLEDGAESGRALLMTLNESSDPECPSSSATFHMIWQIAGELATEVVSHQRAEFSTPSAETVRTRFVERYRAAAAHRFAGEAALGPTRVAKVFQPDQLEVGGYESVNAAILAALDSLLRPYSYLDEFADA